MKDPQKGEIWRHHKGGRYKILVRSLWEEDKSPVVTYESLEDGLIWTRALDVFLEDVEKPEGTVRRFEFESES